MVVLFLMDLGGAARLPVIAPVLISSMLLAFKFFCPLPYHTPTSLGTLTIGSSRAFFCFVGDIVAY